MPPKGPCWMAERLGFFVPCLMDHFDPDAAFQAISVLEHAGFRVLVPHHQVCCGQPWYNVGLEGLARPFVRRFVETFWDLDVEVIVVPSGSCASFLKHHAPHLRFKKQDLSRRMEKLGAKIREFSDIVHEKGQALDLALPKPTKVYYHASCHLSRELGIEKAPIELIDRTKGAQRQEVSFPLPCCGFGGAFSTLFPFLSGRIGERKIEEVAQTGAEWVVSADSGCLMHLASIAKKRRFEARFLHLASFLFEGLPRP